MLPQKTKLIGVAQLKTNPDWTIKSHSHLFHEFIILYKGKMQVTIADQTIEAGQGDVLFYPEGIVHQECIDSQDPIETIYIGWEGSLHNWMSKVHDANGRMRLLAEWLYSQEHDHSENNDQIQIAYLRAILAEHMRLCGQSGEDSLVRKIRAFMRDHLQQALTLDDFAEHACMSKYHFIRIYKKLSGNTPMQELQFIRARTARDLAITTDLPLKTIALKVGLSNPSHLSRIFKKYFDATPAYFRKNIERT